MGGDREREREREREGEIEKQQERAHYVESPYLRNYVTWVYQTYHVISSQ